MLEKTMGSLSQLLYGKQRAQNYWAEMSTSMTGRIAPPGLLT
jgi:hypothetical protein